MTLTSITLTLTVMFVLAGVDTIMNNLALLMSTTRGAATATILAIGTIVAVLIFT